MHDPRNHTALRQLADLGPDPDPPRWRWGIVRPDPEGRLRLPAEARRALRFRPGHRHQVRGICHRVALVVRVEGPGAALVVDSAVASPSPSGYDGGPTGPWSWAPTSPTPRW